MKFAHIGDCHLGGWRQPELKELNFKHFQEAIRRCIKEKVDFILVAGDLFDSPYPPIDTLKQTFEEFRKIKEANISVFLIAGSHDYSISGKTFLYYALLHLHPVLGELQTLILVLPQISLLHFPFPQLCKGSDQGEDQM